MSVGASRAVQTANFEIGDGVLLGLVIRAIAGTPLLGQCFVIADLIIGQAGEGQSVQAITEGYVTTNDPVYAPGGREHSPLETPGAMRAIVGSAPALGADILETVPTGARWDLYSFTFNLTTDAVAGSRVVALAIDDGANVYFLDSPNVVQGISLTDKYSFAQGQNKLVAPLLSAIMGDLPAGAQLLAGHRIRTITVAKDGGDQYTAPVYLVREHLEQ